MRRTGFHQAVRITGFSLFAVLGVPLLAVLGGQGPIAFAAVVTRLDVGALQLEVKADPYQYRLIEKKTKKTLLRQAETTFRAGGTSFRAVRAMRVKARGKVLDADLVLDGTAHVGHVRFSFDRPGVLSVHLTKRGTKPERVLEAFADAKERVYGLFEYPFDGRLGNRGLDRDMLGTGREKGVWYANGRAPFYMTSKGYGVYAHTMALSYFTVGVVGRTGFSVDAADLRYDVIYGPTYADVLARYTAIAGPPIMPPLWALASGWWSDDFHNALHGAGNAQENVLSIAAKLREHRIPAGSMWMDRPYGSGDNGWGNMDFDSDFPDPAAMIKTLNQGGMEVTVWAANRGWNRLYDEGKEAGFLFPADPALGPAADLRKPKAYVWLKKHMDTFAAMGIKGFKIDRGEQGEQPDFVQNENVTLFPKLLHESMSAKHGDQVFSVARNVYDKGRQYTAVWNGDPPLTFEGLQYSVACGLRSGLILMPMWGSDTGGYVPSPGGPTEELFARWFQFSAFSPMLEVLVGGEHTPWYDYSDRMVEITRDQTVLHHELIPYTRSFLHQATQTGAPVMRPLFFAYPHDAKVAEMVDTYLYGSELLVAPVLQAGVTKRNVYLPGGRWMDYHDRKTVHGGGQIVEAAAPLTQIPVFVREGGIVVRGDLFKGNNNWTKNWSAWLRVEVFPGSAGQSRFAYFDGKQERPIVASVSGKKFTVKLPALGPKGKAVVYVASASNIMIDGKKPGPQSGVRFDKELGAVVAPFSGAMTLTFDGKSAFAK